LVSGPMIWKSKNGKYYKKTYLFDESGTIRGQYDQCHLPKVESDFFEQGTGPLLFFCGDTKIAILHSYELLFPEYTRSMALSGVKLIIGCGTKAPTSSEGMKIICKARCIENQIFLAGVWIEEDTDMYGTGIFSPSGTEISEKISSWLYGASIDTESLSIMNKRQFLPSRRPDLYHPVTEFRP
ncbi:MAG TPA: carbon-nitrogen hydrolase family protein, partial [Synergistales bacterium]|nr:carbon-nitrogen hydrolase family protein [Synergistales bacterium]